MQIPPTSPPKSKYSGFPNDNGVHMRLLLNGLISCVIVMGVVILLIGTVVDVYCYCV